MDVIDLMLRARTAKQGEITVFASRETRTVGRIETSLKS
jgi:hypothetical protein